MKNKKLTGNQLVKKADEEEEYVRGRVRTIARKAHTHTPKKSIGTKEWSDHLSYIKKKV